MHAGGGSSRLGRKIYIVFYLGVISWGGWGRGGGAVNRGMQIRWSVPFFRQIRQSAKIFVQIGNHNHIRTQKGKGSKENWHMCMPLLISPKCNQGWRKICDRNFVWAPRSQHKTDTIRNPRQKLQLIHDLPHFQNPSIRLIYRKNPQFVRFLRAH